MARLDALRSRWRTAFAAADRALRAVSSQLPEADVARERRRLAAELDETRRLLAAYARDAGTPPEIAQPFLGRDAARRLLGLPAGVAACVFDLEGVLVGSAALHALAWQRTFDEYLAERVEATFRRDVPPFDPHRDYPPLHGRARLDGVRIFLASRGIRLPEGSPADAPGTATVHGLSGRKSEWVTRLLAERGVDAYDGSCRYLEVARDAGLHTAVVSASAHGREVLERAGLAGLVDAEAGAPTPSEQLHDACDLLGVAPDRAVAFETTAAGVAAARSAGFRLVVGVGERARDGADLASPGLAELLARAA
ncbi:MAG TPA: HAD family hydrolase [Gaiellaceae bacterium]|nr:HAD family hydrolase [Gaiellaceae bacterium]